MNAEEIETDIAIITEALARLKAKPPDKFSPDQLTDGLTSLGWIRHRIDILIAIFAVAADDREVTTGLGYPNSAALLAHTTPLAMNEAAGLTKRGAKILGIAGINPKCEAVENAYDSGTVPGQAIDKIATFLTRYHKRIPDHAIDATVATLITAGADRGNPILLNQALAGFQETYASPRKKRPEDDEDEGIVPAGEDRDLDFLRFWKASTGRWALEGSLNINSGEMLATALSSINPKNIGTADGQPRTPEQLKHDALEEILRRCLTNGLLPNDGGIKPTVTLTSDIRNLVGHNTEDELLRNITRHTTNGDHNEVDETETFCHGHFDDVDADTTGDTDSSTINPENVSDETKLGELTEALLDRIRNHPSLDWSGAVSTNYAKMIACDAGVTPVLCADGKPVALGRTKRFATVGLRRYLITRDGGCIFPGCDRPAAWCDMHHFQSWGKEDKPTRTTAACFAATTIRLFIPEDGRSTWETTKFHCSNPRHEWTRNAG